MTNNQLLDAILTCYLFNEKLKHTDPNVSKKLTFAFIAKAQLTDIDEWRIEFLRKQLFNDGYLEYAKYGNGEPYILTASGIKAAQNNAYIKTEEDKQLDKELKLQTLLSLKRSKTAITISIFAIAIPTLISLYSLWTSKQSATTEEFQQLEERVKKLENSKTEAKTTSNVSVKAFSDTLKKANTNK
jgi:hypothetical protein